jgi:hypothetical protein
VAAVTCGFESRTLRTTQISGSAYTAYVTLVDLYNVVNNLFNKKFLQNLVKGFTKGHEA